MRHRGQFTKTELKAYIFGSLIKTSGKTWGNHASEEYEMRRQIEDMFNEEGCSENMNTEEK